MYAEKTVDKNLVNQRRHIGVYHD